MTILSDVTPTNIPKSESGSKAEYKSSLIWAAPDVPAEVVILTCIAEIKSFSFTYKLVLNVSSSVSSKYVYKPSTSPVELTFNASNPCPLII